VRTGGEASFEAGSKNVAAVPRTRPVSFGAQASRLVRLRDVWCGCVNPLPHPSSPTKQLAGRGQGRRKGHVVDEPAKVALAEVRIPATQAGRRQARVRLIYRTLQTARLEVG